MKTAVIYCRYSSDSQTEQSIDGQLRVCNEYAKSNDIVVLDTYIDRAMTGTNDNRPDFQRMIKDSAKRAFDIILVYKFDRFSRNKYETAIHKKTLKDNGVKVVSATEYIPDSPEAIILESMLEGYSKQKELPKLKEDAKDYLHIKEKTISDTINFVAPLSESIKQIMASFDCEYFDTLLQEKNSDIIKEIIGKIGNQQNINLRSFIFACQKTTDILNYGKEQRNIEFAKALLLSNVAFSSNLELLLFQNAQSQRLFASLWTVTKHSRNFGNSVRSYCKRAWKSVTAASSRTAI